MEYELVEYLGFDRPTEMTYGGWQTHFDVEGELTMNMKLLCTINLVVV